MRKLLSILLLAAFGLPFLAPLLAQGQSANLPICCRRNGEHHCAMSTADRDSLAPAAGNDRAWTAPAQHCPYCPASVVTTHPHDTLASSQRHPGSVAIFSHPAGQPQTESRRRIAQDRSRQKRGPPALLA